MKIIVAVWIRTRLFHNWGDGCSLEESGNNSRGKQRGNNGRKEGEERREAGFNQSCRKRIKKTCGGLGFLDELSDFRGRWSLKGGEQLTEVGEFRWGRRNRTQVLVDFVDFFH